MPSSKLISRRSSPPSAADLDTLPPHLRLALEEKANREKTRSTSLSPSIPDYSRYAADPVAFITEVLGDDPWELQRQIANGLATSRRVTVRSCNGAGKTWLAARLVLWFLFTRPNSTVVTTAPTWHQVRNLLWRGVRAAHLQAKLPGDCNQTELNLAAEWFAAGLSTDEPERFQGFHGAEGGILFIADEASGIEEAIYEAGAGFLTKPDSYVLLIGNPNTPAGYFFETHRQAGWLKFKISALDVPEHLVSREWIEQRREEWGEDSPAYRVRVLGEFPETGDNTLIGLGDASAAQARTFELTGAVEIVLGADIARFGDDESVAYVRRGPEVIASHYWRGNDTQESAGQIAALGKELGASVFYVDEIGVGAGVVDALKHQGHPVVGVNVGTSPDNGDLYLNRRAELFFTLQQLFKSGEIGIPAGDDLLVAQLTDIRYKYTPAGKYQIESKEDMKKRRRKSPDRADALALTFCPGTLHAAAPPVELPAAIAAWFEACEAEYFLPWD